MPTLRVTFAEPCNKLVPFLSDYVHLERENLLLSIFQNPRGALSVFHGVSTVEISSN